MAEAAIQQYLGEHQVEALLKDVVLKLCTAKPDNVFAFIRDYMEAKLQEGGGGSGSGGDGGEEAAPQCVAGDGCSAGVCVCAGKVGSRSGLWLVGKQKRFFFRRFYFFLLFLGWNRGGGGGVVGG